MVEEKRLKEQDCYVILPELRDIAGVVEKIISIVGEKKWVQVNRKAIDIMEGGEGIKEPDLADSKGRLIIRRFLLTAIESQQHENLSVNVKTEFLRAKRFLDKAQKDERIGIRQSLRKSKLFQKIRGL